MIASPHEQAKRRKKVRLRVAMIVLVTLIPTFLTGFFVGKSYASHEKNNKHDETEKVEPSTNQVNKQTDIEEAPIEPSDSEANKKTEDEAKVPDSVEKEKNEKVAEAAEVPLGKVVYLTFDDGPSELTDQFLDILKEEDVKATFFMQGTNLEKEHLQESVKRTTKEGHYIGGHSMTHEFNTLYKDFQFVPEMSETLALIHEITGTAPNLVRPPYGSAPGLKSDQIRNEIVEAGLKVWDWTIDSNDWKLKDNPAQIVESIKNGTNSDREVVLMHEKPQTLAALPQIIEFYKTQGYQFVVYDEANHFYLNFQNDIRM